MLLGIATSEQIYLNGAGIDDGYSYRDPCVPILMEQPADSSQILAITGFYFDLIKLIYRAE